MLGAPTWCLRRPKWEHLYISVNSGGLLRLQMHRHPVRPHTGREGFTALQRALSSSAMVLMSRMRLTAGTAPASAPMYAAQH